MKFTFSGVLVFIALLVGFFLWCGRPQKLPDGSILSPARVDRAWSYCALLFIAGAGTACFGEKEYGMFPPSSLRWLFIFLGVFIMVVAAAWMHALRTSAYGEEAALSSNRGRLADAEDLANFREAVRLEGAAPPISLIVMQAKPQPAAS